MGLTLPCAPLPATIGPGMLGWMVTMQERRAAARAAGICTVCLTRPVEGEYTKCAECREHARQLEAYRRDEAAQDGLCTACRLPLGNQPHKWGRHLECNAKYRERKIAKQREKRANKYK